jgi:hypothetical protein
MDVIGSLCVSLGDSTLRFMTVLVARIPKSVTELLRLEKKRFMQGVCYSINKIPKLTKKRSKLEYINSVLLELREIFTNGRVTALIE